MKIVMLISRYSPVIGGAEIQCERLSKWLVKKGHSVTVLTERSSSDLPRWESRNGLDIIRFWTCGSPPWSSLIYSIQAFVYLLTHEDVMIYHAHLLSTPAVSALAASKITGVPLLIKIAGAQRTGDFGTSRLTALGR